MKKIILTIFIIAFLMISIGVIFNYLNTSKRQHDNEELTEEIPQSIIKSVEFSDWPVTDVESKFLDKAFAILNEWGEKIYTNKKYKKYAKINGLYFISLSQLEKDFSHDISDFVDEQGNVCSTDKSGIYFDEDNILKRTYNEYVHPYTPVLSNCR